MISSCTIMGVPRMTVTYTLQMMLSTAKKGLCRPFRCWSWPVRMTATSTPSTTPMSSATTVTIRVTPRPSKYCIHRSS